MDNSSKEGGDGKMCNSRRVAAPLRRKLANPEKKRAAGRRSGQNNKLENQSSNAIGDSSESANCNMTEDVNPMKMLLNDAISVRTKLARNDEKET